MTASPRSPGCPICGAAAVPEYRPFCSRAHRDRDLLQWLDEGYRIPGRPLLDEDADEVVGERGGGLDTPRAPD